MGGCQFNLDAGVIALVVNIIVAITMPISHATAPVLSRYGRAGVTVYVHTVNEPAQAIQLVRWGAAGVYTDFLCHP